ncbi:MAG TPA: NAD(P)-dependent alcohol dehydrogenase [Actinomycetes bacterium]|nr:NAD(P)-dependent alcohol dehydrogenase [Actinomycetes bacterium]
MKAIVQDTYGPTDALELRDIDPPRLAEDDARAAADVIVRVHASGVERGVWHVMTGLPYPVRLAGYGVRAPKTPVPGRELAGVVEAVGSGVTRFKVGDEVFGLGQGAFAELARAREGLLAPKPASLTFVQAAAVGISAMTALQALRDHGQVAAGQQVLVIGASGGVGTYAVQLAKTFGAEVTGVCSGTKVDLVRQLGADHVVDYSREDVTAGDQRYDLVLDTGGNTPLARLRRVLTPNGTLVIVGGETGGRWLGGADRQVRAMIVSLFVSQKLRSFICHENHEDLLVLSELVEAGKVTPVIDRTYSLSETSKAIDYLTEGHARGKVVVTV